MNIILKYLKNKNSFFINTSVIIISGFIIKILGLINKIIITRSLGSGGMSLYILSFPTILLFLNISTLNINNCISKLISESLITKEFSPKKILISGIKIILISSLISIIIFLIILEPLVNIFLKNNQLFYPLLTTIILIPLTGISDTLKGYYNGIKNIYKTSFASLLEQLFRILFVIIVLFLTLDKGLVYATTCTLLSLSFGELISVLYLIIQIKKEKIKSFPSNDPTKKILSLAIPSTSTKIIGNITYFLEPIIYTHILEYLNYNYTSIQLNYTIINAYTIPLLSSASFISIALSTTIIPNISENYVKRNYQTINYFIDKTLLFSLIPGLLISILFFVYPNQYMNLIYSTTEGTSFIKPFVFFFLLYYLQMPFSSILHAIGKIKLQFIISTIFSILRIILIIILSFIPRIGLNSIFFAILFTMILNSLTIIIFVFKHTKYKLNINAMISLSLITIISISIMNILKHLNINYLINSLLISIIFMLLSYAFNLIDIKSLTRSS